MFTPTRVHCKRPRSPHVVKYLEGIPKPTTLLNHLAGANLTAGAGSGSGSSPAFFTTVPRYIDCKHENRLSTLFFHHVLYPAGGARLPTQAVVVRGGRSVVPCRPRPVRLLQNGTSPFASSSTTSSASRRDAAAATKNGGEVEKRDGAPNRRTAPDPLAVPASQLGAGHTAASPFFSSPTDATVFSPEQHLYNSSHWTRSDAARTSFFYAPHTSRNRENGKGFNFESGQPTVLLAPPTRYEQSVLQRSRHPSRGDDTDGTASMSGESRNSFSSLRAHQSRSRSVHSATAGGKGDGGGNARCVVDSALESLRGVVEASFLPSWKQKRHQQQQQQEQQQQQQPAKGSSSSGVNAHGDGANSNSSSQVLKRVAALAVNPSAGLVVLRPSTAAAKEQTLNRGGSSFSFQPVLLPDEQGEAGKREKTSSSCSSNRSDTEEDAIVKLLASVCAKNAKPLPPTSAGADTAAARQQRPFVAYMQTRLPPEAVVSLPVVHKRTDGAGGKEWICRLAGGIEPLVNFAVGTPLRTKQHADPFSFISCLLRLEGTVVGHTDSAAAAATTADDDDAGRWAATESAAERANNSSNRSGGTAGDDHRRRSRTSGEAKRVGKMETEGDVSQIVRVSAEKARRSVLPEPWRLGGPALDPKVPYTTRTVSEAAPLPPPTTSTSQAQRSSTAGPVFVGRTDCESYLLPQRELLLTLYVPPRTQALCEEQNESRLAKQVKLGHAAGTNKRHSTVLSGLSSAVPSSTSAFSPAGDRGTWGERAAENEASAQGWTEASRRSFLSPSVKKESNSTANGNNKKEEEDAAAAAAFGFMTQEPAKAQQLSKAVLSNGSSSGGFGDKDVYTNPHENQRMTSNRLLARKLHNTRAAMRTGHADSANRFPQNSVGEEDHHRRECVHYEVRALPGDVVYIPCGWAYRVKRIIGTAIVDSAATSSPVTRVFSNRSGAFTRGFSPPARGMASTPSSSSPSASARQDNTAFSSDAENKNHSGEDADGAAAAVSTEVATVSVDAFVLNYKKYPVLSKEQADVYLSANYAHGGITEFYEAGGNPLFYKYE